jgi:osmotically inducible protein OsmC
MPIQTATTVWEGSHVDGKGLMVLGSGHFDEPYSFASRFGDGKGTSPEELLGAAYCGSLSMALAHELSLVGFTQMRILTSAKVCLAHVEDEYKIAAVRLNAEAHVSDISVEKFTECVESSIDKCLVTNTMSNVEVTLTVNLNNGLTSQAAPQTIYNYG